MKRIASVCLCTAAMVIAASPAFAQRDLEIPIQFDFINPGARSLALGGAFIGLADDATASSTNPAGLVQLAQPEVSIEGRGWQFVTAFVEGGRITGIPTQRGIDTVSGAQFAEARQRVGGLSYLSVVYPRGPWRIAGYRQEATRLKLSAQTQGVFFIDVVNGVLSNLREYPSKVDRSLDVANYGGTVAYRAGIVSFGGGLHLSKVSLQSSLSGYDVPPDFFSSATYTQRRYLSTQTSDDTGIGYSGGVLVVPNRRVQFGVSYRRSASFDFDGNFDYPGFADISGSYTGEFKVPDNLGAGVAVRPIDGLLVAVDVNRVTYSDLTDFIQQQVRFFPEDRSLFSVDDATEFHVGAEYVLTRINILPAVRVGVWRETQHAVSYSGEDELSQVTAGLAKDVTHFSIGAGVAPVRRFELNAGFDFSDRANTMSFSAIVRF